MKCEICKNSIDENFLSKIFGTSFRDENGKKHFVCSSCQKKIGNSKEKFFDLLNGKSD